MMSMIEWVLWSIVCLSAIVFLIFPGLARGYVGGPGLFRVHAMIWIVGLILTVALPISKFHLLWIYPLGWIIPYIIFQVRSNLGKEQMVAETVRRHLEEQSGEEVWSYSEMRQGFRIYELQSPRKYFTDVLQYPEFEGWWVAHEPGIGQVKVVRRVDNVKGTLLFKDSPWFYFNWSPDDLDKMAD